MWQTVCKKPILPSQSYIFTQTFTGNTGFLNEFFVFGENDTRYLDPKTSRWISADPAIGEYIPGAPVNDDVRRNNQNLPGMGGVFNYVNLHVYHYAGNNPVKYTDPTGMWSGDNDYQAGVEAWNDFQQAQAHVQAVGPLQQNDPLLAGIENMAAFGCYFRSAQATAELEVGTALTPEQIQESVTALQNTPNPARPGSMVIENDLTVNNPDMVINDAFTRLGEQGATGTVNWGGEAGTQNYVIQRGQVTSRTNHYTLRDENGRMLFDPNPNIMTNNPRNFNVFIHRR